MSTTDRQDYIEGLHALADLLAAHEDVPLPYATGTADYYDSDKITFYLHDKDELAAFVRAFPGRLDKRVDDSSNDYGFEVHGKLCGLYLYAAIARSEVCRRVVTGTREVTEEIPDPEALAAVPTVTVTKTVEDVEWRCEPILAAVSA